MPSTATEDDLTNNNTIRMDGDPYDREEQFRTTSSSLLSDKTDVLTVMPQAGDTFGEFSPVISGDSVISLQSAASTSTEPMTSIGEYHCADWIYECGVCVPILTAFFTKRMGFNSAKLDYLQALRICLHQERMIFNFIV